MREIGLGGIDLADAIKLHEQAAARATARPVIDSEGFTTTASASQQDPEQALRWYERGRELGDPNATGCCASEATRHFCAGGPRRDDRKRGKRRGRGSGRPRTSPCRASSKWRIRPRTTSSRTVDLDARPTMTRLEDHLADCDILIRVHARMRKLVRHCYRSSARAAVAKNSGRAHRRRKRGEGAPTALRRRGRARRPALDLDARQPPRRVAPPFTMQARQDPPLHGRQRVPKTEGLTNDVVKGQRDRRRRRHQDLGARPAPCRPRTPPAGERPP